MTGNDTTDSGYAAGDDGAERTVVMLPDWRRENPYQDLLARGVEQQGWNVLFADFPGGLFPLQRVVRSRPEADCLHIHWIAWYLEHLFWSRSAVKFYGKAMLLLADILLCRARGRRVVWTVHNQVEHESPDAPRELWVRAWLARCVSHSIFHSENARNAFSQTAGSKTVASSSVIPHGNYVGVYPDEPQNTARLADELDIDGDNLVILFFGLIRRYKGVTALISAFSQTSRPELRLVIAGKVPEPDLLEEIESLARLDDRIVLRLGFVPEDEVAPLHAIADVVAIPFERTLTSGSVLLAMSLGKALVLPEAARVLGVVDENGARFFDNQRSLEGTIRDLTKPVAQDLGSYNAESALTLDWAGIGEQTARLYIGNPSSRGA